MTRELILYCDESDSSGKHYGNFYGGALVESAHLKEVIERLESCKVKLNLLGEVKWQKITEPYADKYIELASEIFALVREGKLKLRIMASCSPKTIFLRLGSRQSSAKMVSSCSITSSSSMLSV